MPARRRYCLVRGLVVFAKAILISWALIFLAECLGWQVMSEAGGSVSRRTCAAIPVATGSSPAGNRLPGPAGAKQPGSDVRWLRR
jgi:hypothetical protein